MTGENAVRMSARFIWSAAAFRPWRTISVVTRVDARLAGRALTVAASGRSGRRSGARSATKPASR